MEAGLGLAAIEALALASGDDRVTCVRYLCTAYGEGTRYEDTFLSLGFPVCLSLPGIPCARCCAARFPMAKRMAQEDCVTLPVGDGIRSR